MLYFLLPFGNICSLSWFFYTILYIFMLRKKMRCMALPWIRPLEYGSGQRERERSASSGIRYIWLYSPRLFAALFSDITNVLDIFTFYRIHCTNVYVHILTIINAYTYIQNSELIIQVCIILRKYHKVSSRHMLSPMLYLWKK